ncbi:hypothetical protein ACHAWF_015777 [Thalassiosira exigua]
MAGQSFWPCDGPDLCWCWDTTKPKKPPAPASGLSVAIEVDPSVPSPCEIFTQEMFMILAPNSTFPYTYEGLCNAIDDYNTHHTEKFAAMGTEQHIRHEIAAFLGNTAHESDDFEAGREYLACGDRKEVDGKIYCKPCNNDLYDWPNNICSVSMVDQNAPYNSYCQPSFEPPEGCVCDTITQVEEEGPLAGYVEASKVFYGRGAIQLSWNYNYIRASYALTGNAETFCDDPEQVASTPEYAWGAGIYFWMENQKEGSTCHKEALKGDFGGTLNNINGGLECPAYKGGWHADAIKMRLNRYCHAASELGLSALSSLDGCKGMTESYEECLVDGHCPHCEQYASVEPETLTNSEAGNAATESEDDSAPYPEDDGVEDEEEIDVPEVEVTVPENPEEVPFERTWKPTVSPIVYERTWKPTGSPVLSGATTEPTLVVTIAISGPTPDSIADGSIHSSDPPTPSPAGASSPPPTPSPTTDQPSISPIFSPTQEPTTKEPSYTPTTPQPTMGPCDGEACPGEMCRSAYGFCGSGEFYCTDQAIWSPACRENSRPPSPSPTKTITNEPSISPVEKAIPILNEVFSVTTPPNQSEGIPVVDTGQKPSKPTGFFSKPTGGKPVGGKPKPSSLASSGSKPSSQAVGFTVQEASPPPSMAPVTPYPTRQPVTKSPTLKPTDKIYSPTDPEATYFCGTDYFDASNKCSHRCPSSKSDECPDDLNCFAFTTCMDPSPDPTLGPTDRPTDPPLTSAPRTPAPITTSPTSTEVVDTDGCTGTPCPFVGECRSQYGFCGTSFIYCNAISSWTHDMCGVSGLDANGEPVKCGDDTKKCLEGEVVFRDPSNDCEHFPCPANKEEELAITSSAFHIPASSPSSKFPPLPKPTLPTITKPSPFTLTTVAKPSASIIDLAKKPSGASGSTVLVGQTDSDDDESVAASDEEDEEEGEVARADINSDMAFGDFSPQNWLAGNRASQQVKSTAWMLSTMSIMLCCLLM